MAGDYKTDEVDSSGSTGEGKILKQNFPNPACAQTTIRYELPADGHITLTIYDLRGRKISTLVDMSAVAGPDAIDWNGTDTRGNALASGIYIYRIIINTGKEIFKEQKKLIFIR